jgi:hypothetical protein
MTPLAAYHGATNIEDHPEHNRGRHDAIQSNDRKWLKPERFRTTFWRSLAYVPIRLVSRTKGGAAFATAMSPAIVTIGVFEPDAERFLTGTYQEMR